MAAALSFASASLAESATAAPQLASPALAVKAGKLTDKNALLDRMNDDNCDPSWAMLELLARSGKAAADDLVVLANNGSLKHSKALLEQRYPIKDLLDNSHFLEERDAAAATRNFMYDMGLATLDASGTEIKAPNAIVRELLRRKLPAVRRGLRR